jgi:hypothetical protein
MNTDFFAAGENRRGTKGGLNHVQRVRRYPNLKLIEPDLQLLLELTERFTYGAGPTTVNGMPSMARKLRAAEGTATSCSDQLLPENRGISLPNARCSVPLSANRIRICITRQYGSQTFPASLLCTLFVSQIVQPCLRGGIKPQAGYGLEARGVQASRHAFGQGFDQRR